MSSEIPTKPSRVVVTAAWQDAPHLDEQTKATLEATIHPHLRAARTKGIPQIGSGMIYPVAERDIKVRDFAIPSHWKRGYGMDCGNGPHPTAAVFFAEDPETHILYLYNVYKRVSAEPVIHATAIKARGEWLHGVGDAAGLIITDADAEQMIKLYRRLGLHLTLPDKAVETGLQDVWELLSTGLFKIFASCEAWFEEYRFYRRDEKGRIIKKNDDLMDACLTGDAEVITSRGRCTLAELVGQTGLVLTRSGAWARFCGARQTLTATPVVRLTFEDGSAVTCTPDHPFLTPHGWRRADAMQGDTCYNGAYQRRCLNILLEIFKNFRVSGITFAGNIFSETAAAYIGLFGRLTTAQFQPAWMCTTRTATALTTRWKTSNLSQSRNTPQTTSGDTSDRLVKRPRAPRRDGIALSLAGGGIGSIIRRQLQGFTKRERLFAGSAAAALSPASPAPTSSVQMAAKPSTGLRLAWTTRNALAWCAAAALWRIVTCRSAHARGDALLRCVSVVPAGIADVYCLTVPGPSAFCLANGAVVHNSRYFIRSGRKLMRTKPAEGKVAPPPLAADPAQRKHGWMR